MRHALVVGKPDDLASADWNVRAPIHDIHGTVRTDRHAGRERELFVRQRDVLVRMREGHFLHITATWNWTLVSELYVGKKLG
jgi:hypothetical protein